MDLSYPQAALAIVGMEVLAGTIAHYVVLRKDLGWPVRCICVGLLIGAFHLTPFLFSTSQLIGRMIAAAIVAWWSSMKLGAALLNRGPLAQRGSLLRTILLLSLPVTVAFRHRQDEMQSPRVMKWYQEFILAGGKLMGTLALVYVDQMTDWRIPFVSALAQRHAIYCLMVYFFASLMMDFPSSILRLCTGIELQKHFDNPFGAISFQDLWRNRWNLTAGSVLRTAVYEPIVDVLRGSQLVKPETAKKSGELPPRLWMRLVGLWCTFAASGVAHEIIFWISAGSFSHNWEWYWFFQLQAVVIGAELLVLPGSHQQLCQTSVIYRVGATLVTGALFLSLTEAFFWPPTNHNGLDHALLTEWKGVVLGLLHTR